MRDVERDVEMAIALIGKSESYVRSIWNQFSSGWDGAWCSETACVISYMAGNKELIPISNYALGLWKKFIQLDRLGTVPEVGAFVLFGYGSQPDHTGRVIEVKPNAIVTVEGNVKGTVVKREWKRSDAYIFAYGYPKYACDPKAGFCLSIPRVLWMARNCDYPDWVLWLQMILKDKGYYHGTLDGDFGNETDKAVRKYQEDKKLAVDGIVAYYTLKELLK